MEIWSNIRMTVYTAILGSAMFISAVSVYSIDKRTISHLRADNRELRAVALDNERIMVAVANSMPKQTRGRIK